jgi:hypothetical protein
MNYSVNYGYIDSYGVDGVGLTIDFSVKENSPILVRIVFVDDTVKADNNKQRSKISMYKYDSIFCLLGYFYKKYAIRQHYNLDRSYSFIEMIDRCQRKIVFHYKGQEISITHDHKIVECNNVKVLLQSDKEVKIVIEKGKPLAVTSVCMVQK